MENMVSALMQARVMLNGMVADINIEEDKYTYETEPRWTYQSHLVRQGAQGLVRNINELLTAVREER